MKAKRTKNHGRIGRGQERERNMTVGGVGGTDFVFNRSYLNRFKPERYIC